jgi:hypothetical protein
MERLKRCYVEEAKQAGVELRVFNGAMAGLGPKVENVDAVVVFTNKVSHEAKKIVMRAARRRDIPVYVHHSCGVCSLRDCLSCIKNNKGNRRFQ